MCVWGGGGVRGKSADIAPLALHSQLLALSDCQPHDSQTQKIVGKWKYILASVMYEIIRTTF